MQKKKVLCEGMLLDFCAFLLVNTHGSFELVIKQHTKRQAGTWNLIHQYDDNDSISLNQS